MPFSEGSPAPLNGKPGLGTLLWLLFQQPGSTVRSEPPAALRVMAASGQRICFQALSLTTSTWLWLVQPAYEPSVVVNPVAVVEKPDGLTALRARWARWPSTNRSRLSVPLGTLAR
jgi:hypothetical protein